jgi:hypothetical protein
MQFIGPQKSQVPRYRGALLSTLPHDSPYVFTRVIRFANKVRFHKNYLSFFCKDRLLQLPLAVSSSLSPAVSLPQELSPKELGLDFDRQDGLPFTAKFMKPLSKMRTSIGRSLALCEPSVCHSVTL